MPAGQRSPSGGFPGRGDTAEVYPESERPEQAFAFEGKRKFNHNGTRHIVCLTKNRLEKDAADRQAIIESPEDQLKKGVQIPGGQQGVSEVSQGWKNSTRIDR
ncbi:MAG: hypothetical protein R2875_05295 [Desulfobacterales bacterium]